MAVLAFTREERIKAIHDAFIALMWMRSPVRHSYPNGRWSAGGKTNPFSLIPSRRSRSFTNSSPRAASC